MPLPRPRRLRLPWLALALALVVPAAAGGWWLGHRQSGAAGAEDPKHTLLSREAERLQLRVGKEEASEEERLRLLELLLGLDRRREAIALLEPMADRDPDRWSLRLMLAELRRAENDRTGAERELRQILSRHPNQVEALQLLALLQLEQGRGSVAEARVRKAFEAVSKPQVRPEALAIGLLLGELQQRRGQPAQAETTYKQLAKEFPQDRRPQLALALLRRQRGDSGGAMAALAEARLRGGEPGKPDRLLDELAAGWGLERVREQGKPQPPAKNPHPNGSRNP